MSASPQPASRSSATARAGSAAWPSSSPAARPGRQRRHLDRRRLVPPQRHRGRRHPQRLFPPRGVRPRPPDAGGARLHHPGSEDAPPDAEHPGHHDRHRPDQPRQGRLAPQPTSPTPSGPPRCARSTQALASLGVDALISIGGDDTLKTANKFKLFQDHLPAGRAADRRRPRAQDDRQRLPRHRLHFGYFTAVETLAERDPQPAGRRRGEPDATSRRDDGPQRRLAGLRGRHRRRGQPGHERRGHRRQAIAPRRR